METETSDIVFGVIVLAIFLVFAYIAGRILNSYKNNRFARAWAPLVSIVNGTIVEDNGGAASSYLTGTYKGLRVQSCIVPNRNRYRDQSGYKYNYFDLTVQDVMGKADWRIEYKWPIFGLGTAGWRVQSDDKQLEEQLQALGVIEMVSALGSPTICYKLKSRTIVFSDDITPKWAPGPGRFVEVLDLMIKLEYLNKKLNTEVLNNGTTA